MKKILIIAIVFLFLIGNAFSSGIKLHEKEYHITSEDGVELYAWLTPSPDGTAPLYLLLPMRSYTHESYNRFIEAFYHYAASADTGNSHIIIPNFLSFDLRGHGKSIKQGDKTINYGTLPQSDYAKMPSDVAAMLKRVLADKSLMFDRNDIEVVGASIGANTAALLTKQVDYIKKVAMLSPGENYLSLIPGDAVKEAKIPILIYVSKGDSYAYESSEKLASSNEKFCTLKCFDGDNHGTNIIDNNNEAMTDLIYWLLK